jgi:hypothetical protein
MQNVISRGLVVLSMLFLAPHPAAAQGTIHLSNLAQPSSGSEQISSDFHYGMLFRVWGNPSGYELNSIQLAMNSPLGTPSGLTVQLYSFNDITGQPGISMGTLNGPDPMSSGTFTYSASDILLSPGSAYVVVLTASTPAATGAYNWSTTADTGYNSADGWFLSSGRFGSSDGSTWGVSRLGPFQMAVFATPIPEPSSLALLLCGGVLAAIYRQRLQRDAWRSG